MASPRCEGGSLLEPLALATRVGSPASVGVTGGASFARSPEDDGAHAVVGVEPLELLLELLEERSRERVDGRMVDRDHRYGTIDL